MTLTEEAGIGTTLTDFFMDGVSYGSQIKTLFGTAAIPPRGSITAGLGLKDIAVPKTVVFRFTGVDATGQQWSTEFSVPFQGTQVPASVRGHRPTPIGPAGVRTGSARRNRTRRTEDLYRRGVDDGETTQSRS